jgi:uncharacterized caspase-like protein
MRTIRRVIPVVSLVLGCWVLPVSAASDKRVALVIGNAAYSGITALSKPINDAHKMAEVLKGMKFEVILGTDLTKSGMEELAQRFQAALKGSDVGFFFYSGHGFQTRRVEQQHPVNHLVPIDFKVQEADALPATLALDVVIDALRREARVGFVFMDACRSDPALTAASERQAAAGTRSVAIARGFSPVNVATQPMTAQKTPAKGPVGLLIAYATDPGNVALEGDTGPLSPFTGALAKHLASPGISVGEIMGLVSAEVAAATKGQQTPWNVSSLTAGTYRFVAALPQTSTATGRSPAAASPAKGAAPRGGGGARPSTSPNGGVGVGL